MGAVAREMGFEVVSMDICPKHSPDFCCDVLEFDFSIWPRGWFDMVWASPPCTLYSVASNNTRPEEGNVLTRRCLEIIEYLEPKWYAIENPSSSSIWKQGIFDHIPKKFVSYCMYSDWGYRKNTTIATNIIKFEPKLCKGQCGYVREVVGGDGKKHKYHLAVAKQGISAHCRGLGVQNTTHKRDELYRVPALLVKDILEAIPPLSQS